jgi:hypothetical protein
VTDAHPWHCRMCRGAGWIDGPALQQDRHHQTTSVTPCPHRWWNDDPDNRDETWLLPSHPRAQQARDNAYAQGVAELDAIRNRNGDNP